VKPAVGIMHCWVDAYTYVNETRKRIYEVFVANGKKAMFDNDFVTNSKQARMSSGVSPLYSSTISLTVTFYQYKRASGLRITCGEPSVAKPSGGCAC
jgi:hypothetical protein